MKKGVYYVALTKKGQKTPYYEERNGYLFRSGDLIFAIEKRGSCWQITECLTGLGFPLPSDLNKTKKAALENFTKRIALIYNSVLKSVNDFKFRSPLADNYQEMLENLEEVQHE